MNALAKDKRLMIALPVAVVVCFVLFPAAFTYGIFGTLALVFAAVSIQHLVSSFHRQPSREVCWGAGTLRRSPMSRRSRLLIGLWCAVIAAHFVMRGLLKMPGSPFHFAIHVAFVLLIVMTRWRDTGRFFR